MIWCDLDNTLIWTWQPLITSPLMSAAFGLPMDTKPPSGRGRRRLRCVAIPNFATAHVCARRSAKPFLAGLREVADVRMLTTAARAYAWAMNEAFGFGFRAGEIVSREDLGFREHWGVDPGGILVDNTAEYPGADDWEAHKARMLKFQFIGSKSVVEVPYFRGSVTDEFDSSWRTYVEEVIALKEGRPKPPRVVAPPWPFKESDIPDVKPMELWNRLHRAALRKRRKQRG